MILKVSFDPNHSRILRFHKMCVFGFTFMAHPWVHQRLVTLYNMLILVWIHLLQRISLVLERSVPHLPVGLAHALVGFDRILLVNMPVTVGPAGIGGDALLKSTCKTAMWHPALKLCLALKVPDSKQHPTILLKASPGHPPDYWVSMNPHTCSRRAKGWKKDAVNLGRG